MARTPVLAAGGIVLRSGETPLIAVVRLRKRNEWVLPKGKLDDGETARWREDGQSIALDYRDNRLEVSGKAAPTMRVRVYAG